MGTTVLFWLMELQAPAKLTQFLETINLGKKELVSSSLTI
jgi:hypothetical protein